MGSAATAHRFVRRTLEVLDGARKQPAPSARRQQCSFCQAVWSQTAGPQLVAVPCHVRAFLGEEFHVWRCSQCESLHCHEVVDLDHYYAPYPFAKARLTFPMRMFYNNLLRRFTRHGFDRSRSLLDYGCGNGLFIKRLRRHGYDRCEGFDPHSTHHRLGDPAVLNRGPFDYILLQDVLEHVENPRGLLSKLDVCLRPGGHILIGTPNAARIDLNRPAEFINELHVPYHLHIYTRDAVERLGAERGWTAVEFFDRPYHDLLWPGLNTHATKVYQSLSDGSLDSVFDPPRFWPLVSSPRFLWAAVSGYWRSQRGDMAIMFRKPGQ